MFTFLSRPTRVYADPLQSRKKASAWLAHLSASDVLTRQQQVVDAFESMRRSWSAIDRHRLQAIAHIDQSFEPEHRRLVQCYLDHVETSPRLAARFRNAAIELNQAFLQAYQSALDPVCGRATESRWKALVPLIIIRLVHCLGQDAKLRIFNHDPWIPARWTELHQSFARAMQLGVDRVPVTVDAANPFVDKRCIEQEYIHVLLVHQLDTGNLSPVEIEWTSNRLRDWSSNVRLESSARKPGGFCVDLAGTRGLVRRLGNENGAKLGYIDTESLIVQLDAAAAPLRESPSLSDPERRAIAARQLATIEKVRPALSPTRKRELRRYARAAVDIPAAVHTGFSDITAYLAAKAEAKANAAGLRSRSTREWQYALRYNARDTIALPKSLHSNDWIDTMPLMLGGEDVDSDYAMHFAAESCAAIEHIEIPPVAEAAVALQDIARKPTPFKLASPDRDGCVWRVQDKSANGCRVLAPLSVSENVALHALMSIELSGADDCIGIVRRLHKHGNQIELGVSLISGRAIAVTLHIERRTAEAMSVVVDGVDVSGFGPRFAGVYLLPPANADTRESMRTLLVPSSEYAEGRRLVLTTGRSDYTIVLRQLIERNAEWSWATLQVAEKRSRFAI